MPEHTKKDAIGKLLYAPHLQEHVTIQVQFGVHLLNPLPLCIRLSKCDCTMKCVNLRESPPPMDQSLHMTSTGCCKMEHM